jgi:AcrR family transcriptional regulator
LLKRSEKRAPDSGARTARRTRAEQTRDTRDALMKAALRVVARHGYAKASVARITEAAGVAQGTFYSYFDTHPQLLKELLPSEGMQLLNALGREMHGAGGGYFEHEKNSFHAFFKYMRRNPYFLRVLTEAEIAAPESYAEHMSNIEERYLNALRRAQERGEIRKQDDQYYRVIAEVLSGARGHIAIGLNIEGKRNKTKGVPDWAAETFVKFIRHGIGPGKLAPPAGAPVRRKTRAAITDTRTLLLETGTRLVHEYGYEATTVAGVTKAADVAVGTFYAHFPSRQALLDEILAHCRERMVEQIREAVAGSPTFSDMEQRGFLAFFEHLSANPWYIRVESEAAVWANESYQRHFAEVMDRYVGAMRRSKAGGDLANYEEREFPILACIFMAARHYLSTRYALVKRGSAKLPAFAARAYLDLVANGLERR